MFLYLYVVFFLLFSFFLAVRWRTTLAQSWPRFRDGFERWVWALKGGGGGWGAEKWLLGALLSWQEVGGGGWRHLYASPPVHQKKKQSVCQKIKTRGSHEHNRLMPQRCALKYSIFVNFKCSILFIRSTLAISDPPLSPWTPRGGMPFHIRDGAILVRFSPVHRSPR